MEVIVNSDENAVCQLLTHTSGISDSRYGVLKFKPGQRKSYSNEGYNLLGTIIEGRMKQSYGRYLKKNIDSRRAGAKSVGTDAAEKAMAAGGAPPMIWLQANIMFSRIGNALNKIYISRLFPSCCDI